MEWNDQKNNANKQGGRKQEARQLAIYKMAEELNLGLPRNSSS